jgi:hypothetical protein
MALCALDNLLVRGTESLDEEPDGAPEYFDEDLHKVQKHVIRDKGAAMLTTTARTHPT